MFRALLTFTLVVCSAGTAFAQAASRPPLRFTCKGDVQAQARRDWGSTATIEQIDREMPMVDESLAKVETLRSDFLAGATLDNPYRSAARFQQLSLAANDEELAQLYRRVAADQFSRGHASAASGGDAWAAGLSSGARGFVYALAASRDWCGVDESNTAWLEARIAAKGWFRVSVSGHDANSAAFLIAQHADANRPFQRKVLALLEPLMASGDTRPQDYALLFDRVAVGEGRPQRYGSQGGCTAPATWTEAAVEDPLNLDKRRAEVGLEPMASYRARFTRVCR